ncbi:uncharacterized protein LOC142355965 [Convolutriloba macropyga]|uniref:uncharacterized protein LOC142355965 n=1 Tax=Convolutriloba macropyga TaxID=536237 RepID=UPI003F527BF4
MAEEKKREVNQEIFEERCRKLDALNLYCTVFVFILYGSVTLLLFNQYFVFSNWIIKRGNSGFTLTDYSNLTAVKKLEKFSLSVIDSPGVTGYNSEDLQRTIDEDSAEGPQHQCFEQVGSSISEKYIKTTFSLGTFAMVHHINVRLPKLDRDDVVTVGMCSDANCQVTAGSNKAPCQPIDHNEPTKYGWHTALCGRAANAIVISSKKFPLTFCKIEVYGYRIQ